MHKRNLSAITALSLAVAAVSVGSQLVSGVDTGTETVFVPVTPCRLIDTRPGNDNVGPRRAPLAADTRALFNAHGPSDAGSPCDIPITATAVATNVVAVNPSARSFLTLFPGDVANPGTANLNYVAGQAPTPNAANIPLAADGGFNVDNFAGTVNVVIDINGCFQPSTGIGAPGPAGAVGVPGPTGAIGPAGPAGPVNRISNTQIATLRWDQDPGTPGIINVGNDPRGVAFDGTNVWVANAGSDSVSKINPATNTVSATVPAGDNPSALAFDGTNIWVTNSDSSNVFKLNPS